MSLYASCPSDSRSPVSNNDAPTHDVLIFSKWLTVRKLMSKNRSTQFARHPSSDRSSAELLTLPVMHFFQHICVKLCVSDYGSQYHGSAEESILE